jgi:glucose-6-phosphate isomerase
VNSLDNRLVRRLWQKDLTLWGQSGASDESIASRLGWLDAVEWMEIHAGELMDWAGKTVDGAGVERVVVLGMGGSSLAADVFSSVFGAQQGYPELEILDTTSPEQIAAADHDLDRTLFIVASKSGTTLETASLYFWFFQRLSELSDSPGKNFIAITDEGSWLQQQASRNGFLEIFLNPADIGGRYSALSYFGLVPAALLGVDLVRVLESTAQFKDTSEREDPDNPVYQLASTMADCARAGRSKMQLQLAEPLQSLAPWVEQLVAESTGKDGKGILPVCDLQGQHDIRGQRDMFSVAVDFQDKLAPREGGADIEWGVSDEYQIGAEILRWELATALASGIIGVNPFDQPDVEGAKALSRKFVEDGDVIALEAALENQYFVLHGREFTPDTDPGSSLESVLRQFHVRCQGADYLGVLAYLPGFAEVDAMLARLRANLGALFRLTTTLGYGPRYLHSTGQFHKGGPPTGCFFQIVEDSTETDRIPGKEYGFARLHHAQADGDFSVLEDRGRPVMRIRLKGDRLAALDNLVKSTGRLSTF